MGNILTPNETSSDFIANRRQRILDEELSPEQHELLNIHLSQWRQNESKQDLQQHRQVFRFSLDKLTTLQDINKWGNIGWNCLESFKAIRPVNDELNSRVSLYCGDITKLEVDAIVNAANSSFLGGGGIDGAIHNAAGELLLRECASYNGLETGCSRTTKGYRLPSKYVIHTVGPTDEDATVLERCYKGVLDEALKYNIKTVAFCCIGTGIYGFPLEDATQIALRTVRSYLEVKDRYKMFERIIFVVFLPTEEKIYNELLPVYFPLKEAKNSIPKDPVLVDKEMRRQKEEEKKRTKELEETKQVDKQEKEEDVTNDKEDLEKKNSAEKEHTQQEEQILEDEDSNKDES